MYIGMTAIILIILFICYAFYVADQNIKQLVKQTQRMDDIICDLKSENRSLSDEIESQSRRLMSYEND